MFYNFKCEDCVNEIELNIPMKDRNEACYCPCCGGEMKRILGNFNFILKGDNWESKKGY